MFSGYGWAFRINFADTYYAPQAKYAYLLCELVACSQLYCSTK